MKYGFDVVVSRGPLSALSILTFGGDRETFGFTDPENFRRLDIDGRQFFRRLLPWQVGRRGSSALASISESGEPGDAVAEPGLAFLREGTRVFSSALTLSFQVPGEGPLGLALYDAQGRRRCERTHGISLPWFRPRNGRSGLLGPPETRPDRDGENRRDDRERRPGRNLDELRDDHLAADED